MKKILTLTIIATVLLSIACYLQLPKAEATDIQLTVSGLVDNPLNLTLADLQALPTTSIYAAIICVDAPSVVLEEGNWTGVRIQTLLETAAIQSGAVKIGFFAEDGYSTDLTLQVANESGVILAYEKDGQSLGGLRLVIPGRWGYKWINQVSNVEVLDYDYLGFWESRGYSDSALISDGPQGPSGPNFNPPATPPTISSTPTPSKPSSTLDPQETQLPQSTNSSIGVEPQPTSTEGKIENAFSLNSVYVTVAAIVILSVAIVLIVQRKAKR